MVYTKLFQATLTISMVLGFYIFLYNKIKNERIDDFIQAKYKLWKSRNFELTDLIREEAKRYGSIDSCELRPPAERRGKFKLRQLLKKIVALTETLHTTIRSSYKLNEIQCCIELTVQDCNYYIAIKSQLAKKKLSNFFSRKKRYKLNYNLMYKTSSIYEGDNIFLVMKMLVRSLIQEIGPDTLFRQDILFPTTDAPTTDNAPVRRPGT